MKRMLLPMLLVGSLFTGVDAGEKDGAIAPPAGFVSLFNGKDLKMWKDADKQPQWKVVDGTIHYDGGKGARTSPPPRITRTSNFGSIGKSPRPAIAASTSGQPQVQIWDSTVLEGNLKADRDKGSGGLWNNKPGSDGKVPLANKDKKVGEWNRMYIKMVGTKVTVVLNDTIVVDNAVFLDGKIPAEGPIELQVHGTPLWFRNVFVKEIVPPKK